MANLAESSIHWNHAAKSFRNRASDNARPCSKIRSVGKTDTESNLLWYLMEHTIWDHFGHQMVGIVSQSWSFLQSYTKSVDTKLKVQWL